MEKKERKISLFQTLLKGKESQEEHRLPMAPVYASPEVMLRKQENADTKESSVNQNADILKSLREAQMDLAALRAEMQRLCRVVMAQENRIQDLIEQYREDEPLIPDDPDPVTQFMKMVAALDEECLVDEDSVRIVRPQDTETAIVYASPEFWNKEYPGMHGDSDEPAMGEVYASPPWDLFD